MAAMSSFSDACGSALTPRQEKSGERRRPFDTPQNYCHMANPQERSFVSEDNKEDEHLNGAMASSTPQKKMLTTSREYEYNYSTPKDGSSGDDSANTNPNQGDAGSECVLAPRSYSPFQDMWQKYSGHFSPPSLQTLEEGKQMLQKRFASFFDDACASSSCQYPEHSQPAAAAQMRGLSDSRFGSGLPGLETTSSVAFRRSPIGTIAPSDKATTSIDLHPDSSFLSNDKQRTNLGRAGLAGTVRGGVRDRRNLFSSQTPTQALRQSPTTITSTNHENIEVNSDHEVKVMEPSPESNPSMSQKLGKKAPVETLEVRSTDAFELERSISELTMRSSYGGGESLANIPDNRRMAYYAVGKNHRQSGRGGNRRCYFSGKLILGGAPFYAGAVQQGLRTLVVFCLPSALNLPDRESILLHQSSSATQSRRNSRSSSMGNDSNGPTGILRDNSRATRSVNSRSIASRSADKRPNRRGLRSLIPNSNSLNNDGANSIASKSRMSSLDDLSLSIDGDLDPNWGLDRDLLLRVLPEADAQLLESMASLFPEQFETLPLQVRDHTRWRLYVKFCFFSGLPIAEGEMHYKVLDELAEQVYGEEIVLSHDVMEAVNGDVSAEILQLPNQKVFRYLRKHYAQQCSKLDDRVFRRNAWIRVAPEV
ncbi:hypothetical protein ACA910_014530 [Epithemia clementina (nom. ined.)]